MMIEVSVVIPVYNAEQYIEEAINSILIQRNVCIEVICIDDASNDGSYKVLKELSNVDSRIKIISLEENSGQAHARNIGISKAKGEYVYFLDSDDKLNCDNALYQLYNVAEENKAECVVFDSIIKYEKDDLRPLLGNRNRLYEETQAGLYRGKLFFDAFFGNCDYSVAVWRQFWRKDYIIKKQLYFDKRTSPHEDLLFSFKAFFLAERVVYYSKTLHQYLFRENSSSSSDVDVKRLRAYERIYIESLRFIEMHQSEQKSVDIQSLNNYFKACITPIQLNFARLLQEGKEQFISCEKGENQIERFYMKWIIMQKYPMIERLFSAEEITLLRNNSEILLYGAGGYSIQLQQLLLDFGIRKIILCTTDGEHGVPSIKELLDLRETCVLIIATSSIYKKEMKKYATKLGFKKIIDLGEK